MTDCIIYLPGVTPTDAHPHDEVEPIEDVIDLLKDLLERAYAGEVVGVTMAIETREDILLNTMGVWTWANLISSTAQLAFRSLVEALRAEAEQVD